MITVAPVKDKDEINSYYEKVGIKPNDESGCVVAGSGEEVLGFCLYTLTVKGITVLYITPQDDLSMADGILRSALHVAASRSAMVVGDWLSPVTVTGTLSIAVVSKF